MASYRLDEETNLSKDNNNVSVETLNGEPQQSVGKATAHISSLQKGDCLGRTGFTASSTYPCLQGLDKDGLKLGDTITRPLGQSHLCNGLATVAMDMVGQDGEGLDDTPRAVGLCGDEGISTFSEPTSFPPCVQTLISSLNSRYLDHFSTVQHASWLTFPSKPSWTTYIEPHIRQRRHNSLLLAPPLEMDEVCLAPGQRILMTGPRGSGRTVWSKQFAYRFAIRLLPGVSSQFKIALHISSSDLKALLAKTDEELTLEKFIDLQIARITESNLDNSGILSWLRDNSSCLLLVIDIDSSHCCLLQKDIIDHLVIHKLYPDAGIILSVPQCSLDDIVARFSSHFDRIFDLVTWLDDEILKYLRDFSSLFHEDDARTDFLEFMENLNCCRLLQIASNVALTCLLYYLDPCLLSEKRISSKTDLYDLLFFHLIRENVKISGEQDSRNKTSHIIAFTEEAYKLVCDGEADGYVLQIQIKDEAKIMISSLEFQEFLAAKYISLRYYQGLVEAQVGNTGDISCARAFFHKCWATIEEEEEVSYKFGRVCVFLSALIQQNYLEFLFPLEQMFHSFSESARLECRRVCNECIQESYRSKHFVERIKTIIGDKSPFGKRSSVSSSSKKKKKDCQDNSSKLSSSTNDTDYVSSFTSLPDSLDAQKLSSLKLNEATLMNDEALQYLNNCLRKADNLRDLEIDFTPLDPYLTQRVAFSPGDIDYLPLKQVVTSIRHRPALVSLSITARLAVMSWDAIDIISDVFSSSEDCTALQNLESLSLNIDLSTPAQTAESSTSSLYRSVDPLTALDQNVTHFVSRLNDFLASNSCLQSIEISTSLLSLECLPQLQSSLLNHPTLTGLRLRNFSTPVHKQTPAQCAKECCDVIWVHPYSSTLLADLIHQRQWLDISLDLVGCQILTNQTAASARSLSTSFLNGVGGSSQRISSLREHPTPQRRSARPSRFVTNCSTLPRLGTGNFSSVTNNASDIALDGGDHLQYQVISAFHNHPSVERVTLHLPNFHPSILDSLTDLIERCPQLQSLYLSGEALDDLFLLAVGCGVVCATRLELLAISGSMTNVTNGGSLPGLLQSCSMSPSLSRVQISANPLSIRGLDSLCISLPDIPMFPTVEKLCVGIEGHVMCRDTKAAQKKIDKLAQYTFGPKFELNLQLTAVKKAVAASSLMGNANVT